MNSLKRKTTQTTNQVARTVPPLVEVPAAGNAIAVTAAGAIAIPE